VFVLERQNYYARIYRVDEGPNVFQYGVTFPDIPGCVSCADTFEEAVEMAKDALETWFDDDEMTESDIPQPSCLEELIARNSTLAYDGELSYEFVLI
jgi:predicted RNase H-like HicB family nuclease